VARATFDTIASRSVRGGVSPAESRAKCARLTWHMSFPLEIGLIETSGSRASREPVETELARVSSRASKPAPID